MTTKITKEELRRPDIFLYWGQKIVDKMLRFQMVIIALFSVILLVSLGWIGMNYMQTRRDVSATAAFYPVEKQLETEMEKDKKVSDKAIAEYEKIFNENLSSRAAMVSLVSVTPVMIRSGRAEQALGWFKSLRYEAPAKEIGFGLAQMTLGVVALEANQLDVALAAYQTVIANSHQKTFHAEAILKSGIAYQMKNESDKAREAYERVRREFPKSSAGELALSYLLALQTKKGA